MIDKIVLSSDSRTATVIFETHTVSFYSDCDVLTLVDEIIHEPSRRLLLNIAERERRELIGLEDTQKIDLQLSLFDEAA